MKVLLAVALVLVSCVAFYYSLFWGWASGTGPVDQPQLKFASNVALGVSFITFWSAIALFVAPYLVKKRRKRLDSGSRV